MNKSLSPARKSILKRIQSELDSMYQWSGQFEKKCVNAGYSKKAFNYMHRAEALIELLEAHDCGSHGGFDPETGDPERGLYSLEERFEALKKKGKK